jgi:transposase
MDVGDLPNDLEALKALILNLNLEQQRQLDIQRGRISELEEQRKELEAEREELQQLLAWFRRKMFGPRSEKINDNQLLLFGQSIMPLSSPAPVPVAPVSVPVSRPRGHGRRLIPANLPREIITLSVPEEQKACPECGSARVKIGEEVSEQLEFIPARLFVRRFVREKLACKACEANVITAEKPAQVVEKGLAGPGLIAHIATCKYADHLPLYRIEGIFARYGIEISRSTMCDWMGDVAKLARPLVELMHKRILSGRVIHSDDTTVPVQQEQKTKVGRLWVYLGDSNNPYNVYEYTPDRTKEHPKAWLAGFSGYLQADAYAGYDEVYKAGIVKEVACWAHARRKFFDAKDKSPEICHEALRWIGLLYDVEREGSQGDDDARLLLRQQQAIPLLEQMHAWLLQARGELLPKNPAGEAITYTLNQWEALVRYTEAGYLAIDNNAAEREMRPVAVGRKNWLFAGSDEGGRSAAILYSLIRSAQRQELNVEYYLRSVFAHLPGTKLSELEHLLPDVWKRELAQEEARSAATIQLTVAAKP